MSLIEKIFRNSNFWPRDIAEGEGGEVPPSRLPNVGNIRVVGTRSLNGVVPAHTVIVQGTRPYVPLKETKLLRSDKACPYWKENGWNRRGRNYAGYYQTQYGKFEGSIEESFLGNYSYYIFYPPGKVTEGTHGACFRYKGNGMYFIHFSEKPDNVSEGIISVEMVISESMNN